MTLLASLKRIVCPGGDADDARNAAKASAAAAAADNRLAPRLPRTSTAQLLQYPAGRHQHPIDVQVTDYSSTGIGVIYHEGLLIGRKFVVREPHVTDGKTCLFTVVRCDPRGDGTYSIGLHVGNSLGNEHDPLLEIPAAPGISRGSKILFVVFAVIGFAMIFAATMLKQYVK
jgi:hypothetical protein